MTSSLKRKSSHSVDNALLAPWIATGQADPQDVRLFAAALASDPALADDLAAARAEHAAVAAMGEAMGRPSIRPLLTLFAAIDAEEPPLGPNVTRLNGARPRAAFRYDPLRAAELHFKKINARR